MYVKDVDIVKVMRPIVEIDYRHDKQVFFVNKIKQTTGSTNDSIETFVFEDRESAFKFYYMLLDQEDINVAKTYNKNGELNE